MSSKSKKFYTIGWYNNKKINLSKKGEVSKVGKNNHTDYDGSIVFKNINDIKEFCDKTNSDVKDLSIFELLECKEKDIYKKAGNYYLLNSKLINYLGNYYDFFKKEESDNLEESYHFDLIIINNKILEVHFG